MTRRAARAACPEALVLEADREQEAALFELVAAAVDTAATLRRAKGTWRSDAR